ncbi:MAG: DUF6448 family protein [Gemmatimonas sp.]
MRRLAILITAAALLAGPRAAFAHCDTVDGPVAHAVAKALDTGNVYLVLPYAPADAEPELKASFAEARKVRALGPDARALADRSFLETAIRLHRAGEGVAYTGLKPGGIDFGPMIPAAERAVETGDLQPVRAVVAEEVEHALGERLAHVRELQKASREPSSEADVDAARERISAELGFITYAEAVHQLLLGKAPPHHED